MALRQTDSPRRQRTTLLRTRAVVDGVARRPLIGALDSRCYSSGPNLTRYLTGRRYREVIEAAQAGQDAAPGRSVAIQLLAQEAKAWARWATTTM
jgi:hypothetical protein